MFKKITILFSLWMTVFGFSQSIESGIDSTSIKIGSQLNLIIKAKVSKNDKVVFPESPYFGSMEVLESYPVDSIKGEKNWELIKKYGLTQFDSGKYVIPPLKVLINDKTLRTDSFPVQVNDVVVDTIKQQMYDIKKIVAVEKPTDYFWIYVLLGVVLILLLGYLVYYFMKKNQTKKNEKEAILYASPIEKALTKLQYLEEKELWQKGETKGYYSELTDIARNYLEEAVEIPAMESTSGELYESLRHTVKKKKIKLGQDVLDSFKRVMSNADLVKFAKSKPQDFEIENDKKMIDVFLMSLDKAIPRSEEETENLFAEELKRKKERSQKLKRIWVPISLVLFLLLIGGVFITIYKGAEFVKDNFLGHSSKSVLTGEWVTSEYGDPSIKLSTPKALVRINDEKISNNLPAHFKSYSRFIYGSMLDNYSITLSTTAFKDTTQVDVDLIIETELKQLEQLGVDIITVKDEEFDDSNGLKGKKAYGSMFVQNPLDKEKAKMTYEIYVFSQVGGVQELFLIYREEDQYAKEIMERVFNSVEMRKTKQ